MKQNAKCLKVFKISYGIYIVLENRLVGRISLQCQTSFCYQIIVLNYYLNYKKEKKNVLLSPDFFMSFLCFMKWRIMWSLCSMKLNSSISTNLKKKHLILAIQFSEHDSFICGFHNAIQQSEQTFLYNVCICCSCTTFIQQYCIVIPISDILIRNVSYRSFYS